MMALSKNEVGYISLARLLILHDHNYREAKIILHDGLKKFPNSQSLWQILALVEYNLGNNDGALQAAKAANTPLNVILGSP
jgi:predicted Zn-dependent protease